MDAEEWLTSDEAKDLTLGQRRRERMAILEADARDAREAHVEGDLTQHDMVADLHRCADEFEELGWHRSQIGLGTYRRIGKVPEPEWVKVWGQFVEFKRAAGLEETLETRRVKARIAQRWRTAGATDYYERHMAPHLLDPARLAHRRDGEWRILVMSDLHATFADPFVLRAAAAFGREREPDMVVVNGDLLNLASTSRHLTYPGHTPSARTEFAWAGSFFRWLRGQFPEAVIAWVTGNHDLENWARHLAAVDPEIADLPSLRLDAQLDLEGLDVKLAAGGKFCSPEGQELQAPMVQLENWVALHGHQLRGRNPHRALERFAHSWNLTYGHFHREDFARVPRPGAPSVCAMALPPACRPEVARDYIVQPAPQQPTGFGFVKLWRGHCWQHAYVRDGDVLEADDSIFLASELADSRDAHDPMQNWMARWTT